MRKQLITSVMLAAIAAMIGVAVVGNEAASALEQEASQSSNQAQNQDVAQLNSNDGYDTAEAENEGAQVGDNDADANDDQSNDNTQVQSSIQSIIQKAKCKFSFCQSD